MSTVELMALIDRLPAFERERVEDYVRAIEHTADEAIRPGFRFDWAGGLAAYRGQYTSLELQKKAMEWMSAVSR